MSKLKVGIIGLGRIACLYDKDKRAKKYYSVLTHAGAYSSHPGFEITCGADINKSRLTEFGRTWKVRGLYSDYSEMLRKEEIDVLSVCTHSEKHYEIIKVAAPHVKVIFCEKPFCQSSGQIRKIIDLQKRYGLKIEINLYRQYDYSHRRLMMLIKSKRYGDIQRVNCYYGKGLRNMGSHVLGFLSSILGVPLKIQVLGKKKYPGVNEYSYDVFFIFKNHIPVLLQSCDFKRYRIFEFDFLFDKGRVCIVDEGLTIKGFERKPNKAETGAFELVEKPGFLKSTVGSALYSAVDHLAKLKEKQKNCSIVSPEDYLKIQKVIEEIERQGRGLDNG